MIYLNAIANIAEGFIWQVWPAPYWESVENGVRVSFKILSGMQPFQRRQLVKAVGGLVNRNSLGWIIPGQKTWKIDLDLLRKSFSQLSTFEWMSGQVQLEPEFESIQREVFGKTWYEGQLSFNIIPEELKMASIGSGNAIPPIEIYESLPAFQKDHPDPTKVAFIAMRFGQTKPHDNIVAAIRDTLKPHGILALRADDKEYHPDVFPNILTYIYGTSFAIAVFERIEIQEHNPNVALEVGYLLALRKNVCLLKDKSLQALPTDLVGKLYRAFDVHDPSTTIGKELGQWLQDKGIVKSTGVDGT